MRQCVLVYIAFRYNLWANMPICGYADIIADMPISLPISPICRYRCANIQIFKCFLVYRQLRNFCNLHRFSLPRTERVAWRRAARHCPTAPRSHALHTLPSGSHAAPRLARVRMRVVACARQALCDAQAAAQAPRDANLVVPQLPSRGSPDTFHVSLTRYIFVHHHVLTGSRSLAAKLTNICLKRRSKSKMWSCSHYMMTTTKLMHRELCTAGLDLSHRWLSREIPLPSPRRTVGSSSQRA